MAAIFIISLINSLNFSPSNPFVISICTVLFSKILLASLVRDYLPLPPTPISIAFPLGERRTRNILRICCIQVSKNTRCILVELLLLYSSSLSSKVLVTLGILSLISSYSLRSLSRRRMSLKRTCYYPKISGFVNLVL